MWTANLIKNELAGRSRAHSRAIGLALVVALALLANERAVAQTLVALPDVLTVEEDDQPRMGNVVDGTAGGKDTLTGGTPTVTRYAAGTNIDTTPADAGDPVMGAHGSLTITTAGVFTYEVSETNQSLQDGGSNTDTFTYEVSGGAPIEGVGGVATSTLTITIRGDNDDPEAVLPVPDFPDGRPGSAYSEPLTGLFTDVDAGDTMTFTLGTCDGFSVSGNNVVGSQTGTSAILRFIPSATSEGEKSCLVTVTDSQGAMAFTTITINVFRRMRSMTRPRGTRIKAPSAAT